MSKSGGLLMKKTLGCSIIVTGMEVVMIEMVQDNLFVFTRDLIEDYRWLYKPRMISADYLNIIINKMEQVYCDEIKKTRDNFISQWYQMNINDNYGLLFRVVVDGRKDVNSRLIRRFEGSIVPKIEIKNNIADILVSLEESLKELQRKSNNYNYGFIDTLQNQNPNSQPITDNMIFNEECQIIIKNDGKVEIQSDTLNSFIQRSSNFNLGDIIVTSKSSLKKKL